MTKLTAHLFQKPMTVRGETSLIEGTTSNERGTTHAKVGRVMAETGTQSQAVAQLLHATIKPADGADKVTYEVGSLMASAGIDNADGSRGYNVAVSGNLVGVEATFLGENGGSELTLGVAAGVGAAFSTGYRDRDRDGAFEYCTRITVGPVTVGGCIEAPKAKGVSFRR